jgi:uncharacterized membrane protein YbhN (UPF0104 family)
MREIPWRRIAIILEVVLVPVGLLVLIWLIVSERSIQSLAHAGGSLLVGVGLSQLSVLLFSMRVRLVLTLADVQISAWEATRLHVQSMFYFFFVPFGVGTEIYKVAKLYSALPEADRVGVATAVVFDRLLGFLTVLGIAFLCGLIMVPRFSGELEVPNALLVIGVLVCAGALGIALFIWLKRRGILMKLQHYASTARVISARAIGLSLAMQLTLALAVYFAARGWSIELSYFDVLFATASAIVFQVVPLSILGVGAAEVVGVAIYLLMGLSETDAVLMVSSGYAYRLLTALLGGVWQLSDRRAIVAQIELHR